MDNGEKMRMCPYCEGTVPLESSSCRFCGSSFDESLDRMKGAFREEREDPYYNPPYSPDADNLKDSVYHPESKEQAESLSTEEEEMNQEEEKGHILALMLLSAGGMLFTLSILLLFFSEHGRVTLEWKSRYWSLYMILGLPLLYYGFKKLRKL